MNAEPLNAEPEEIVLPPGFRDNAIDLMAGGGGGAGIGAGTGAMGRVTFAVALVV